MAISIVTRRGTNAFHGRIFEDSETPYYKPFLVKQRAD